MNNLNIPKVPRAFPVFCQKVLPLTFDNSLSYLEFLAHVNAKLNETIDALNNYGVYIEQVYQIINDNFEQLKIDVAKMIDDNKTEILGLLDDLRDDLTDEINELNGRVEVLESDVTTNSKDIDRLTIDKGTIDYTPKYNAGTVEITSDIMSAKCDIYYKNPLSDIYHPWKTETTISDYIAETTAEDVGERELLFMFWNFKFPEGGYITASYPTFDTDCFMQIYTRANIPEEDFNTGLTACGSVSQSGTGSITVRVDVDEDVPAVNCLFISNQFALNWLTAVTPLTAFTTQKIAELYSRENGEKVFPLIKINNTLAYDSNGVLGAVSALPATLPDNLLYFGTGDSVTADAYSLIFDTECVIYENYSDGVTQNSWKKYNETTLRDFLPNYTGWLNPSTGTSKNLYVFFKNLSFPTGFKFLSGADGIETGYTGTNYYSGTWVDFGHSDTLPTLADIPSFVRLYKDSLSLVGDSTHRSRTAANWDLTIPTDRAKFAYIYGNAFFFGSLKTTLLNGGGRADTWYITTPSITYPIVDEDSNTVKISLAIDGTLQNPQGVLGVSDSLTDTINNIPSALATKQNVINSSNKISADYVDDSDTSNKFATAAELAQIATNTTDIAGKQNTIDSSHMLSSDLVDDSAATNKFATAEQLEQIELNKYNISLIYNTLIGIPNVSVHNWVSSITHTENVGTITVNGTAGSNAAFVAFPIYLTAGTYTFSGCPTGGGLDSYSTSIRDSIGGSTYATETGEGATVTINTARTVWYNVRIAPNYAVSNIIFKPLIQV